VSGRRLLAVAVAGGLAIVVLFTFLLLAPKIRQIGEVRDEIAAAEDEGATLAANIARLEGIQGNAPEIRARLARVSDLLPSTAELPSFIRQLQSAASKDGIDLVSIAPAPPADTETAGVQSVALTTTIGGSFHRIESFLARVETLRRVVEITSISLSVEEDELSGTTGLVGTLGMRMYVVQEDVPTVISTERPVAESAP